ncbi:Alpha-glucan water dikinase 2 [Morella rubra]|uniref:Alpha-glucan water dikinase 2 n=1 Tax=Morella rubra TaxID=262757 RepID=A0A6A1UJ53_9ROSI|nr:Alpha-glucan water dikinase 2 [Morella rubra]
MERNVEGHELSDSTFKESTKAQRHNFDWTLDAYKQKALIYSVLSLELGSLYHMKAAMASSKPTSSTQVPQAHNFELIEGMQLQELVHSGGSSFRAKDLQARRIADAIFEDGSRDRWFVLFSGVSYLPIWTPDEGFSFNEFLLMFHRLKLDRGNFRIEIPKSDATTSHPSIPKDLIERKAYLLWESKGRPISSAQQQKQDYDEALRELQIQLLKGVSLNELQKIYLTASTRSMPNDREEVMSHLPHSNQRRLNVEHWLQKHSEGHAKSTRVLSSALLDLVERSMGGDNVVSCQSYHIGNDEIVVLLKVVGGDSHILVATSMKGSVVLHWGISKSSPEEWLAPPPEMLPQKSKLVSGACQTYFTEISTEKAFFQVDGAGAEGIVKWLLDEISRREKDAERSLMHRFNIATELMERCKNEGELGLIGILVWFRFMACRHLTWNKNYNVKPR